jgi:hypothetical protein
LSLSACGYVDNSCFVCVKQVLKQEICLLYGMMNPRKQSGINAMTKIENTDFRKSDAITLQWWWSRNVVFEP